jgi:NADH dehydrogenase/NADH:ubiquinone oxidoreductase subunit G
MESQICIIINNKLVFVSSSSTVFQACHLAKVQVPSFCFHERLIVAGNCRICLVEIKGSSKLEVSCTKMVFSGISVFTQSPPVLKAREAVLEFILKNHPLDCPICDQGGECDLQEYSYHFGSGRSRFFSSKRSVKMKVWGPLLGTVITRCIFCTRCIRFSLGSLGFSGLGSIGRGERSEIHLFGSKKFRSIFSGNLIDLCPVCCLTFKFYLDNVGIFS